MTEVVISPFTRISGLLSIDVYLDAAGIVREANCQGEQFRGFEAMLRGRKLTDAVYFTQRICGICSLAHGYTAARLLERIYGLNPSPESVRLRQAMLGAEFLQNHLRHFYLLALPDYLGVQPSAFGESSVRSQSRLSLAQQQLLTDHYFAAMAASRQCHEMLAVFGGKIPHQHGLNPQGVAVAPTADRQLQFLALLEQVRSFINEAMLPDSQLLAAVYPDYFGLGLGVERYISFGLFDPAAGPVFPGGVLEADSLEPVRLEEISEGTTFSRFEQKGDKIVPAPDKPAAYSWVKAVRYHGLPFEGGPLARKFIRAGGIIPGMGGVMGRLLARTEEAWLIASWLRDWVEGLPPEGEYISSLGAPIIERAVFAGDAMRGPLLHAATAGGDEIAAYSIITPSMWNFSPKDATGRRGPAEEAIVGAAVPDPGHLTEIGRIVRSFDPCLSCATHLIDWQGANLISVRIMA